MDVRTLYVYYSVVSLRFPLIIVNRLEIINAEELLMKK
jgi:hypothetical protein